ncbi:uncharacterized protein [Notamacropus eugenii]|uniref:uncharacterized protein n=1 Tax=Notamacropus eugenii TaxID=9315 RepID=UPI003B67863F
MDLNKVVVAWIILSLVSFLQGPQIRGLWVRGIQGARALTPSNWRPEQGLEEKPRSPCKAWAQSRRRVMPPACPSQCPLVLWSLGETCTWLTGTRRRKLQTGVEPRWQNRKMNIHIAPNPQHIERLQGSNSRRILHPEATEHWSKGDFCSGENCKPLVGVLSAADWAPGLGAECRPAAAEALRGKDPSGLQGRDLQWPRGSLHPQRDLQTSHKRSARLQTRSPAQTCCSHGTKRNRPEQASGTESPAATQVPPPTGDGGR